MMEEVLKRAMVERNPIRQYLKIMFLSTTAFGNNSNIRENRFDNNISNSSNQGTPPTSKTPVFFCKEPSASPKKWACRFSSSKSVAFPSWCPFLPPRCGATPRTKPRPSPSAPEAFPGRFAPRPPGVLAAAEGGPRPAAGRPGGPGRGGSALVGSTVAVLRLRQMGMGQNETTQKTAS